MSLILDALNRSRQDSDPVPGLASQHYIEEPAVPTWRRHLPWVALAVALLLIVWLLLERRGDSGADEGIAAPVAQLTRNLGSAATAVTSELKARVDAPRPQVEPISALETPPAPATAPVTAVAPVVTVVPEAAAVPDPVLAQAVQAVQSMAKMAVEQRPDNAPAEQREAVTAPDQAPADSAVAALYQAKGKEPAAATTAPRPAVKAEPAPALAPADPATSQEQPIDLEKMLLQARSDIKNTGLVEHSAPFLASLSQRTKDEIPTILYQRHDYSDKRGISSVVINGKNLRVGGSPAAGVKVDEILPDSVVLSYKGTQFRLRALNSWVNL